MIKKTDTLSIRILCEESGINPATCELSIENKPIQQHLSGNWLKSAFQCDVGYLVFLSEDHVYEETLNIYFLDFSGNLLDSATFFDGNSCNFQVRQPNTITFELYEGVFFKIVTLAKRAFKIPIISDPLINFKRPLRFSRHFLVQRIRAYSFFGKKSHSELFDDLEI